MILKNHIRALERELGRSSLISFHISAGSEGSAASRLPEGMGDRVSKDRGERTLAA